MRDDDAYVMARGLLGGLTEAELQYLLAVSRHETSYGDGWKRSEEARRSNNMGAITATRDQPHFEHPDTHADGTRFISRFKTYPSKEAGLLDLALVLMKPNVRAALKSGDGNAAAAAQKANGYFEATLASYQAALARNHAQLVKGAGIAPAVKFDSTGGLGLLLLLAALAYAGASL